MSDFPSEGIKPNLFSSLRSLCNPILDVLFPIQCRICFKKLDYKSINTGYICMDCWDAKESIHLPYCLRCGHPAGDGFSENCSECKKLKQFYFSKARGVTKYSGVIRQAIHFWKYSFKEDLKFPLTRMMEQFILTGHDFDSVDMVIPVPLHPIKLREREFNQAEYLAEPVSALLKIPLITEVLYRTRYTRPQMELSAEQRLENVKGLFAVRNSQTVQNKKILLVDDVMTTGATVNACSKVLREAGCADVNVLVLARGQ